MSSFLSSGSCFHTRIQSGILKRSRRIAALSRQKSTLEIPSKPSIAIVGSGAVGGYYGARLWECGSYNVKFHMRGANFLQSKEKGLQVSSIHGDIFIPPDELQAYTDTREIGKVDWVIVALKSSALDAIPSLICPLLKPNKTKILAIMNGMIEDDLIRHLKHFNNENNDNDNLQCCAALLGGMALVCSNRIGPGSIDHTYAGKLSGGVAATSSNTNVEESLLAFRELWKPVKKVETVIEASLLGGRWRKNVWNLPFNGISVAMGGITVDKIVNDPGLRNLAYTVMDETIAAANADLSRHGYDESYFLGDSDKKECMDLSDGMGPYKTSTMLDFVKRNPMEVEYLFKKPVERAKELGIDVPHLETLVTQIEAFQSFSKLF